MPTGDPPPPLTNPRRPYATGGRITDTDTDTDTGVDADHPPPDPADVANWRAEEKQRRRNVTSVALVVQWPKTPQAVGIEAPEQPRFLLKASQAQACRRSGPASGNPGSNPGGAT